MASIGVPTADVRAQVAAPRRPPLQALAITRRSSLLLQEGLALEEWVRVGVQLDHTLDSSFWWLGDWLVYGRTRFPERYRRVVETTDFDYQTLRNYAWVANRVDPPRRRPALSFQHHAEVAALSGRQQEEWLARAEENRWSRNRLRAEVRAQRRAADRAEQDVLRFKLHDDQLSRWREAASQAGQELAQWMTGNLDAACADVD